VDRGSPVMANRLLGMLKRMFAFAVERDILESSPCFMVKAPTKEAPRDRVLSQPEISTFWHALETAKMSSLTRLALKLLLVTGQRRDEVVSASWSEFDLDDGAWEIPAERSKSGRAHRTPLSPLAVDLLSQLRELGHGSSWLFPSPKPGQPMAAAAVSHALRNNLEQMGVERFTPHDLRRTCASRLAELGISRFVVARVLGHSDRSITGVYDRFEYWPQKKQALDSWGQRLMEIVSGKPPAENVVQLATAGKAQ
jgi:integrase